MKKYLSILILAILIIPVIPISAIPTVAAQQVVIETSRDEWGNVWKNQIFYVDVEITPPPEETYISLAVVVAGTTYYYDAERIEATNIYRAWFYVDETGALRYLGGGAEPVLPPEEGEYITTLSSGDVISFQYGGVSKSLEYTHIAPELSIRSPIPQEVEKVGIKDWVIRAPDLNRDPRSIDIVEVGADITIRDYTADVTLEFSGVVITETSANSGKFEVFESYIAEGLSDWASAKVGEEVTLELSDGSAYIALNITFSVTDTGNVTTIELLNTSWIVIYGHNITLPEYIVTIENIPDAEPVSVTLQPENFYRIDFFISISRADDTYTVEITELNVIAIPEYLYALAKRLAPSALEPGNIVDVWASVPEYIGAVTIDTTASQTLEIKVYYGTVSGSATLKSGLTITVEDKGRNYRSYEVDVVAVTVTIGTHEPETVILEETDIDTGVFKVTIPLRTYYAQGYLSNVTKDITITYVDSAGIEREVTVEVEYFTGRIANVSPSQVVPGLTRLTVKIDDTDLNLNPEVREDYTEALSANDYVVLSLTSAEFGITLGEIKVYAVIDGKDYLAKAKEAFNIVAVEEGLDSSAFTIVIDLSKVNLKVVEGKLEAVKIVYVDYYTPTGEVVKEEVSIPIAKISLDVKEDSVPINAFFPVKVHIEVADPSANVNPGVEDRVTVVYEIYNVSNKVVKRGSVTLVETGWDTGVFTREASIDLTALKPDIINGYIKFIYTSERTGEVATDTVAIKLYPTDIKVNATRVKYGDWLEIKVIDKEFNLDQTAVDEFTAEELKVYGVPPDLEFKETGPNTGEFVAVIQISKDLGDPATWITIEHEDFRPIYATSEMREWEEAGTAKTSVRVYIESFDGKISTDKTEYGPIATITITVKDADQNAYPDEIDSVRVRYFNPVDGRWYSITLEETGSNTGVFEATLSISALGTPDKVIGKTIRFIYVDPCDATGASAVFSTQVKVISWTAKIETDKKSYVLGEKIKIKVTDPDANLDPNAIDSITVHVYTETDPAGTYVTLYETDVNTGVFDGEVLISDIPGPGRVMAKEIDTVHIKYIDRYPEGYPEIKDLPIILDVSVGVVIPTPIEVPKIVAVDPKTGERVEKFKVGTLAGIMITLKNVATKTKTVAVIAVIYDPNGVSIAVQAFKLPIAGKASADLLLSFIPKLAGTYTVKIYVAKGLTPAERVQILSPEPEYTFTVTVVE